LVIPINFDYILQHLKYSITSPIFLFKNMIDDTKLSHLKIKTKSTKWQKYETKPQLSLRVSLHPICTFYLYASHSPKISIKSIKSSSLIHIFQNWW
jgi:hypothetical protein